LLPKAISCSKKKTLLDRKSIARAQSETSVLEQRSVGEKVPAKEPARRVLRYAKAGFTRALISRYRNLGPSHMEPIGRTRWAIAEGYIPSESSFSHRALLSHETACILNAGDREAHVAITIFFADREPVGPYRVTVGARRTLHLRFNDLEDPAIPRDTDYSSVFESDEPIVVQHTRLDSRRPEVSLLSTTAYAQA
jgi:hypothetical protein